MTHRCSEAVRFGHELEPAAQPTTDRQRAEGADARRYMLYRSARIVPSFVTPFADDLKQKVALVTGGGSGIGQAASKHLAAFGARVAVLDRDASRVRDTCAQIAGLGGQALPLVADIRSSEHLAAAYEQVRVTWGRLDVLFANAGINGVWAPLEDISESEWDETVNTNVKGTFLTIKHALPALKERGGSIMITSSINGTRTFSNNGASLYGASKAAQLALGLNLALELARFRIRVNVLCPGTIRTRIGGLGRNLESIRYDRHAEPQVPLGTGPAEPEEVAKLVVFLASEESRHITGTPIWIDGGESVLWG